MREKDLDEKSSQEPGVPNPPPPKKKRFMKNIFQM